jgi:hypothetical protein
MIENLKTKRISFNKNNDENIQNINMNEVNEYFLDMKSIKNFIDYDGNKNKEENNNTN